MGADAPNHKPQIPDEHSRISSVGQDLICTEMVSSAVVFLLGRDAKALKAVRSPRTAVQRHDACCA